MGWGGGGAVIPPDLYQIWHSSQAVENGSNYVGFKNAEADEAPRALSRRVRPRGAQAALRRMQEILYDEQPYTFLYTRAQRERVGPPLLGRQDPYPGAGLVT